MKKFNLKKATKICGLLLLIIPIYYLAVIFPEGTFGLVTGGLLATILNKIFNKQNERRFLKINVRKRKDELGGDGIGDKSVEISTEDGEHSRVQNPISNPVGTSEQESAEHSKTVESDDTAIPFPEPFEEK